jgi:hypothetical protein
VILGIVDYWLCHIIYHERVHEKYTIESMN